MKIEIDHILCPVDFSEISRRALRHAMAIAKWYGSRVTVLHVVSYAPAVDVMPLLAIESEGRRWFNEEDRQRIAAAAKRLAHEAVGGVVDADVVVVDSATIDREILGQAAALDSDLIVMGTHGRSGFDRLMLGSVTEKVMRKAECPVMAVPPHAEHLVAPGDVEFDRILCAVDFSDCSLVGLLYALSMAEEADARITVVNVIEKPPELDAHPVSADFNADEVRASAEAERLGRLRALIPKEVLPYCSVETAVWEGRAWRGILALAADRKSDLIVMGVRGRGAVDLALFGSNTHGVIRGATCPVLTVPES